MNRPPPRNPKVRLLARAACAALAMIFPGCSGDRPERASPGRGESGAPSDAQASRAAGWLHTRGNHVFTADGRVWAGRGANIHDTRSCNACTTAPPNVAEVNRRVDELVDRWHADFLRLALESYPAAEGRVQWRSLLDDPGYLQDIVAVVRHVETKPGVVVLVSLWIDPSLDAMGWPTGATIATWRALATALRDESRAMFGIANEPQSNQDGALDARVWAVMNDAVAAIREVEAQYRTGRHVIAVQGTRSWGRRLDYYVEHPITAGGGANIVYETHVYDPASNFQSLFGGPSEVLPVIIGEFGPAAGSMTEADCAALMREAQERGIPYLAWTFHPRCSPNLLVDNTGGGCGVGMALQPTSWGRLLTSGLTGMSTPPGPPISGWDPHLTMGPNCNEWWVEVYADAASVTLVQPDGSSVELPRTSWGSFAISVHLPAGTMIRLVARASDGRTATSSAFPFLRGQPTW